MEGAEREEIQSKQQVDRIFVSEGRVLVLHWQRCGVGVLNL